MLWPQELLRELSRLFFLRPLGHTHGRPFEFVAEIRNRCTTRPMHRKSLPPSLSAHSQGPVTEAWPCSAGSCRAPVPRQFKAMAVARLARRLGAGRRAFSAVRDDMELLSTQIVDDVAVVQHPVEER